MGRNWTEEQLRVIGQKDSNLLVAAAAGSGKTAVMVERIIGRVLSKEAPLDIDRIIVVTFTKAAAAQMRERIGAALGAALKNEEDGESLKRIRRQSALLDNAIICTIDSFCNYILRNYFNSVDLDPSFRIGDEGELKLLMSDAADQVIEEAYAQGDTAFLDFVEAYLPGKSDRMLSEWIMGLYSFSQSHPFPEEWLEQCKSWYRISTAEEFENAEAVRFVLKHIRLLLEGLLAEHEQVLKLLGQPGGIEKYIPAFESDCNLLRSAWEAKDYTELAQRLDMKFERLANAPKDCDDTVKKYAQDTRKRLKAQVEKLRSELLSWSVEENVTMIQAVRPYAECFIGLVLKFTAEYDKRKREDNVLSFSDVEHLALKALLERNEEGGLCRTYVAEELSRLYEEIYIDEYQDSNMVQELILTSISRGSNMFMVGDIKQSIYSFRQADPRIFLEKFGSYQENGDRGNVLIKLHRNFRSRDNVLYTVNDIFKRIMHSSLGGVEYDEEACLVPGREFPPKELTGGDTELLLCCMEQIEEQAEEEEELTRRRVLAAAVAKRIRELMESGYQVWDEEGENGEGGCRPVSFRDIVVLLRSANVSGPEYTEVLNSAGIPAVCNTSSGYFSAREVAEVLNFLSVIDNPRQDIALAGALRSYFCYLTAQELARIKLTDRRASLYDCVLKYGKKHDMEDQAQGETEDESGMEKESGEEAALLEKVTDFLQLLEKYRRMAAYMPIHELVRSIIYDTDYIVYAAAMEGGKRRAANLDMLVEKAAEYEKTNFHGLFNFLRYIEKIQKYEIDLGEADILSERDDVVRVMSIHKSKGLEFPVVFVGDMEKKYNLRDSAERISFHADYGVAMDHVDLSARVRKKSFLKRAAAESSRLNAIGEELRVLYVALTRAVEKLILVGAVKDEDEAVSKWQSRSGDTGGEYGYVYNQVNYLDLVAPAFYGEGTGSFQVRFLHYDDILGNGAKNSGMKEETAEAKGSLFDKLTRMAELASGTDEALVEQYKDRIGYRYHHAKAVLLPGKFSVSELKHEKIDASEEEAVRLVQREEKKPVMNLVREPSAGAERGNAYHKVFELFDYSIEGNDRSVEEFIEKLVRQGKMSSEYGGLVRAKKFVSFLGTKLGQRMKRAALAGRLFREQQFITGFPAKELKEEYEGCEDLILIQGIIDCYFEEEDGIVIVDYKTDHVEPDNGEEILTKRYQRQLELYRDALSQITGKRVKECVIYSVSMDREIPVG